MNHLIVDDAMRAVFPQTPELTEVRTEDGKLVGFFVPARVRKARMWAEAPDHLDTVNLLNGQSSHHLAYTTRQVFEHLLRRSTDEQVTDDLRRRIARMKAEEVSETLEPEPPPEADPPLEVDGAP